MSHTAGLMKNSPSVRPRWNHTRHTIFQSKWHEDISYVGSNFNSRSRIVTTILHPPLHWHRLPSSPLPYLRACLYVSLEGKDSEIAVQEEFRQAVTDCLSGISRSDNHLVCFRGLDRVIIRVLFDRQLIEGHMLIRRIYKHFVGLACLLCRREHEKTTSTNSSSEWFRTWEVFPLCA